MPHEVNLGRGDGVGLVDEIAERALQGQGFGGEGAGGLAGRMSGHPEDSRLFRSGARAICAGRVDFDGI